MVSLQLVALVVIFIVAFAVSLYLLSHRGQPGSALVSPDPVPALDQVVVAEIEVPEPAPSVQPPAPATTPPQPSRAPEPVAVRRQAPADLGSVVAVPSKADGAPAGELLPGHLAISGQVLDGRGEPVTGIALTAIPRRVIQTQEGLTVSRKNRATRSGPDGRYAFEQLHPGEYAIRTTATERYPRVEIVVQAGIDYANLVLLTQEIVALRGVTRGPDEIPLADVRVSPRISGGAPSGLSNSSGQFALKLVIKESLQRIPVRFEREGFQTQDITVQRADWEKNATAQLDVTMTPLAEEGATVTGTVRSTAGEAISGETVKLHSTRHKRSYRDVTDEDGNFEITGVNPGKDYQLWIHPQGPYQKHFVDRQNITDDGSRFDIVLEGLEAGGRVYGQMVDPAGSPVPHLPMSVYSNTAPSRRLKFTGDFGGHFEIENVPAGSLTFLTYSEPRFSVSGVQLSPDGDVNVTLVLDTGQYTLSGYVTGDFGAPVAVNEIQLSWHHSQGGIRSNSMRKSSVDKEGRFSFTGLGPGLHTLSIREPGYLPVQLRLDPGQVTGDISIRLEKQQ